MLLLTWWTWYIWSHVAVEFINAGYEIAIIDNLSNSIEETINSIEKITWKKPKFYKWDIKNKSDIENIFQENNITAVIHFAWSKAVWESCDDPFYYYENNIVWTLNILEIMDEHNVKNMVFSSSANVYWPEWISPFSESHEVWNTSNPYGTTKFIIERLLRDLSIHKWFNVINLRYIKNLVTYCRFCSKSLSENKTI